MNFGYHLARWQSSAFRTGYKILLPAIADRAVRPRVELPFEVYSYSSESALPEQIASVRSFLKYAGRPRKFTVVSDGTHSDRSRQLISGIDPSVVVTSIEEWVPEGIPAQLMPYFSEHPTGKQLRLIMCLPRNGPALYLDSDVLFFPGARSLVTFPSLPTPPAFYLMDCQLAADERLFRSPTEELLPVNTGVLFLCRKLDWSLCIERLLELEGAPTFFTNQTATHLTMHANGAQPFEKESFVLQLDDQFTYSDFYAGSKIVLRHYVNPVRHKFWTSLLR